MEISELIGMDVDIPNLKAKNKKCVLQEISGILAKKTNLDEKLVFDVLLKRERLGTTGVGQGVAIPHGKFKNLDKIYGLFARIVPPIDFDSVDELPVDLVFLLLVPEQAGSDHLKVLAKISRLFRNKKLCEKLRGSVNADALFALLTQPNSRVE